MRDTAISVLQPSAFRFGLGVGSMAVLAIGALFVAFGWSGGGAVGRFVFFLIACGAAWAASTVWNGGRRAVLLTEDGLVEDTGEMIAPIEHIAKVDRGAFAVKPSNGFVVYLTENAPRGWRFGLWWRYGRRVGVGGLTPGHMGRAMADQLALILLARGEPPET